jgi:hypothetical protein
MARLVCVVWDDGYGTMPLLLPRTANSYPPPSSWNLTCLILELGHFFDLLELELELLFLIISFILHFFGTWILLLLGIWRAAIHLCVSRRILAGIMFFLSLVFTSREWQVAAHRMKLMSHRVALFLLFSYSLPRDVLSHDKKREGHGHLAA